jgi:hypothetical protein
VGGYDTSFKVADLSDRSVQSVYGLVVDSPIRLPGLPETARHPDFTVRFGETPERLRSPSAGGVLWQADATAILKTIPGLARFLISEGRTIDITALGDVSGLRLACGLASFGFGPILHQRGYFVLHASSVCLNGSSALAIAGYSGAGKTSLLLACMNRGAGMLSDDLTALKVSAEGVEAFGGLPLLGVSRDTASYFKLNRELLHPYLDTELKYSVQAASGKLVTEGVPLRAVIVLDTHFGSTVSVSRLRGRAAFAELRRQTRGLRIAEGIDREGHFQRTSRLSDSIPVYRMLRPRDGLSHVEELADRAMELLG